MPHGFFGGEAFGVRQLAAAFKQSLEKQAYRAVFKSGSKLPHSEGALRARILYGIGRQPRHCLNRRNCHYRNRNRVSAFYYDDRCQKPDRAFIIFCLGSKLR
jgi:hypothetical protein